MQNAKVIDADGHVQDRDADIRACMEEPFCRRQGPLVAKDKWDSSMYGKLGIDVADVPTRLRDMDREGIEVSVLFPTSAFGITQSPEKDYAAAFCRGYNDWIASVCKESPRLKGIGLVPFQDVPGPAGEIRFDTFLFAHTVARPFETMIDCAALIYGGVAEKFPKLRIAFLECGCGWVPYWMDRMDEEWEKRQCEAPLLKAKPSEYITHGNWFFAGEPEESTLPYVMDRIGDKKIIFASDYPHWDGMFPYVVSTIRERKDISEESKQKFLGENARRLYGWD